MQFKSDRLSFRLVNDADFPYIYLLQTDPVTMRFIRPVVTEEAPVRERMATWEKYTAENPGFGVLIIKTVDNQENIGYAVFRHLHFQPGNEVEIGYSIGKEHTGKGLATEAAKRLMQYGREAKGITQFIAYTNQLNLASNRVLEKCGFTAVGEEVVNELDCFRWEIAF
ncbi:MAG: GNAT family N-acetyltransferase [Saprospiraceae bacterium]|nr:GNAT family N-acetyltransferase [Saprospiraceae bacterium]MCF8249612.1 GNAT family N-acetyltransferase [Saprospiraceae bacterium]MCF8280422.1 GNAT family N-acetyltransferase [Bacteroidales bacterium]MCF8310444.1 GNAT family N-acetyltransferase [Saprospiraceae bacterium]MCF8439822.1 GNAT family N-acetyltransferase [Saprospiraceae bacterium]